MAQQCYYFFMKPDGRSGNVTLEHSRDRRYARAAARRVGSSALKKAVNTGENQAWSRLYNYKYPRVTRGEISTARMWGWVLNYKFTEFKSESGVIDEVARDFANNRIGNAPTQITPEHVSVLTEGLGEIAEGGHIRAAMSLTRKSTAAQMLEDLHQR